MHRASNETRSVWSGLGLLGGMVGPILVSLNSNSLFAETTSAGIELRVAQPATTTSAGLEEHRARSPDPATAIARLRRLTGLSWEELARLLGVTRRALHFWASGRPPNERNRERLYRLLELIECVDRGSARENRALLTTPRSGTRPLDLLEQGRFQAVLDLLGPGSGPRPRPPRISREALQARRPPPPEVLADALQEPVHREAGEGRPVRTPRRPRREQR